MRKLFTIVLVCACATVLAVVPSQAADEVTIGEFVQELARIKQVDAKDLASAVGSLSRVGVRIPPDMDFSKSLTEGDVARMSRLAGLDVTTTRPEEPFGARRLTAFFEVFASELRPRGAGGDSGTRGGGGPGFDPYGKGNGGSKGKKKGHRSPTAPE